MDLVITGDAPDLLAGYALTPEGTRFLQPVFLRATVPLQGDHLHMSDDGVELVEGQTVEVDLDAGKVIGIARLLHFSWVDWVPLQLGGLAPAARDELGPGTP